MQYNKLHCYSNRIPLKEQKYQTLDRNWGDMVICPDINVTMQKICAIFSFFLGRGMWFV